MNKITRTFKYGDHEVTLQTGHIARQADAAVMVSMNESSVLVTAVAKKTADPGRPFFSAHGQLSGKILRRRAHSRWFLQA